MTSRLCLIPLLLASHTLDAQQQPLLQTQPQAGGLQASNRAALLTSNPINQVLPADSAFELQTFAASTNSILLHWDIQPGYYLYRKSIKLTDATGQELALMLPAAHEITDEYFGEVEVYYESLDVEARLDATNRQVELQLEYQGCAESLYCYPPQHKQIGLTLP
jgi:thiol:disulfide interchange protein DsbD